MTDHTTMSKVSRLEVIETGARRRWTLEEKRRIVSESHDGRQVSATARRNGLSASQLFTWRRLAREGRLVEVDNGAMFAQAVMELAKREGVELRRPPPRTARRRVTYVTPSNVAFLRAAEAVAPSLQIQLT